MNTSADQYFLEGCGRCSKGGTPDCKVHLYAQELAALRTLILETGLEEDCKWGSPCYTLGGKNVVMLSAFKDSCFISFFKGALLQDSQGILTSAGPNSKAARLLKFQTIQEINTLQSSISAYLFEAIEVEKAGLSTPKKSGSESIPDVLLEVFAKDPEFQKSFEGLTPGRQRGYILHFTGAKQEKTKLARIEKNKQRILNGYGMNDCVCGRSKRLPNCDGSHKYIG